jgi:ribosomal protein S3AE
MKNRSKIRTNIIKIITTKTNNLWYPRVVAFKLVNRINKKIKKLSNKIRRIWKNKI